MKTYLFILFAASFYSASINAQNNVVTNYLQQTKDFAEIYNGKLEVIYNIRLYENFPYYMNTDFTDASIVYKNNYYPNQKVRLDLFREQLILLSPEKMHGITLNSPDVKKVMMYNKTFVWLVPSKESGLKTGYYIQLLESEKMQLFCKENDYLQTSNLTYSFEKKVRYYLLYNDRYYPVKNKGSFSKLFPHYKKQINQFVKDHQLNFKQDSDKSLTSLAGYCEELITLTNKQ